VSGDRTSRTCPDLAVFDRRCCLTQIYFWTAGCVWQLPGKKRSQIARRVLWKYVRQIEEERIRLAEEVVCRVSPSPFEYPTYLALLAYQAASIEIAFGSPSEGRRHECSTFLRGTVHAPNVNAFANIRSVRGYAIIGIHSGLVELMYQTAKAVVACIAPGSLRRR
jgi:hypothetical protein